MSDTTCILKKSEISETSKDAEASISHNEA